MWPADLIYALAEDRQRSILRDRHNGRVGRKRRRRR
jgi:hypothetical protein